MLNDSRKGKKKFLPNPELDCQNSMIAVFISQRATLKHTLAAENIGISS